MWVIESCKTAINNAAWRAQNAPVSPQISNAAIKNQTHQVISLYLMCAVIRVSKFVICSA